MLFKLYTVRIFSFNWDASFKFYSETLGLPVFYSDAELGWAQFDVGGCYLGLEKCDHHDPEAKHLVGRFVATSLQVDDIELVYTTLCSKGVEFVAPPEKQPWGGVLAHFKDPDGNVLTLLEYKDNV